MVQAGGKGTSLLLIPGYCKKIYFLISKRWLLHALPGMGSSSFQNGYELP
jgi:hypothetical protein